MKNGYKYSLIAVSMAVLVLSCQKAPEVVNPAQEQRLQTFTLSFPEMDGAATKVSNNLGTVGWEEGDQLVFQGCPKDGSTSVAPVVHTLTASEITDPKTAVITVDLSSLVKDESTPYEINVAYPAGVWSSYSSSHTYGRSRFTGATNRLLMAGYINGSAIELVHVTAVLFFKVPASLDGLVDSYTIMGKNEEVLGYDKYLVEINNATPNFLAKLGAETYGTLDPVTSLSGPVTADGTTLHAVYFQNEVNFTNGFTIQFKQGGEIKKIISSNAPLHLVHGHGVNLGELPAAKLHDYVAAVHNSSITPVPADDADEDLSKAASANCYIVNGTKTGDDYDNAGKIYKFKAYKGKSTTHVGSIQSVGILWETYNTADAVTQNTVVAAADYDKQSENDYYEIVFQMPTQANFHRGNAVIAAYDGPYDGEGKPTGNILWSWHIWVPATAITSVEDGSVFSATNVMDRNLGALVKSVASADTDVDVKSLGLMYQWGRKDPFVNRSVLAGSTKAEIAGAAEGVAVGTISLAESIANPRTLGHTNNGDWMSTQDNSLWSSSKTIYDPCPVGYHVPGSNTSMHVWSNDNKVTDATGWAYNTDHYWFTLGSLGSLVFPDASYRDDYDVGSIRYDNAKPRTVVWSSSASGTVKAYCLDLRFKESAFTRKENPKARVASVRCVAEP